MINRSGREHAKVLLKNFPESARPARVCIIILNWNGWGDTIECLDSLRACTYPSFNVVIVDNASEDDSCERIERWCRSADIAFNEHGAGVKVPADAITSCAESAGFASVELIRAAQNLGFCAGNNAGLEFACSSGADYILILNNDTICEPGFIEPMVRVAQSDETVGLVSGYIFNAEKPDTLSWAGQRLNRFFKVEKEKDLSAAVTDDPGRVFETNWLSGCMMLMPRRVFVLTGGFDERFFLWSEDIDLSLRVLKLGLRLCVTPAARIYHKVSRSIGKRSPLSYYYFARNSLLLSKKHNQAFDHFVYICFVFGGWCERTFFFLLRGRTDSVLAGWRGMRDYFLGRTGRWDRHEEMYKAQLRKSARMRF